MRKCFSRISICLLMISLLITSFTGCGDKGTAQETSSSQSSAVQASTAVTSTPDPNEPVYPLKTGVTLEYWCKAVNNVLAVCSNLGDTPFAKELQKKTGVNIKFIHPAANQEKEQFNIMIASGDLPDIIEYDWLTGFTGGIENAISSGYILKLNETIDKYSPNLKKYLAENEQINKMVKTDSGSYYVYPFLKGDEYLATYQGPYLRKDWLDDLGLQVPTTMDEWYTVLQAFKEKKNAAAPLVLAMTPIGNPGSSGGNLAASCFVGAYGIAKNFYVEDGKVKYGPAQPEYKEFLATFRKWYDEGLLDKDFATIDSKIQKEKMLTGKSGATIGNSGGGMGTQLNAMKGTDTKFDLVAAPYPVLRKGDKPKFGQKDALYAVFGCAAITQKCKNVEAAARLLDYGYSEEGQLLYNFGIEGESYTMVNGVPTYTDIIMKNSDPKLTVGVQLCQYARASYNGPFIQAKGYMEQYTSLQQQKDAITVWSQTDAEKYLLPSAITPTAEESSEYVKLINEIDTYINETMFTMILGSQPIENFDKYIEQLKKLNIDRAVEIQQAAYDRYIKR